ncbi:REP-associated tyrosine transposase, partial [Gracilimonas amylolytica]|uniref:REP-associated tyrosine transposase n=1 Tax=Gracilimonas amylolytica TaxID=1749045 RepID=UPI000CD85D06
MKRANKGRSRYKFHEDHYPYFITSSTVEWYPLFMDTKICEIILDALKYVQEEHDITLYGYVIMPNHIHMVVEGKALSARLRAFKSYTARSIINYLKANKKTRTLDQLKAGKLDNHKDSEFQVWQEGFHPKQVSTQKIMRQKINYIHYNPVKSGFVSSPLYWRYSSALNYEGEEGLIS